MNACTTTARAAALNTRGPVQHKLGAKAWGMATVLAALLAGGAAQATVVDIVWSSSAAFAHKGVVAPGKVLELCAPLAPDTQVSWAFESDVAMASNVHFHEAKTVVYAFKQEALKVATAELAIVRAHDYCWMWTNASSAAASFAVKLQKSNKVAR